MFSNRRPWEQHHLTVQFRLLLSVKQAQNGGKLVIQPGLTDTADFCRELNLGE